MPRPGDRRYEQRAGEVGAGGRMALWMLVWMEAWAQEAPAIEPVEAAPKDGVRAAVDARPAVVVLQQAGGTCAGSIVDDRGTIVTAYHCVAAGFGVRVEARDGRVVKARVVSSWPRQDLAILEAPELAGAPVLPLASAAPEVGSRVTAIGHPLAAAPPYGFLQGTLRWSVTEGLLSATGPVALQTSASLNPGNSGGPMLDEDGALVGVVSRKAGEGIGFATRVEKLAELQAAPRPHGFGGGRIGGFVSASALTTGDGGASVGLGIEVALRDLLTFDVAAEVPITSRWMLIDGGPMATVPVAATVGVRGHLGQGPSTLRAGLYGGVGMADRQSAAIDAPISHELAVAFGGGARVEWIGATLGFGVWRADGAWLPRIEVRSRLPGGGVF